MPTGNTPARRPGGRTARVQAAVFAAALAELVEKGYARLSVPEVAARAGVHKTTVYRRWKHRDALLVAALESFTAAPVQPDDTGDLTDDLRRYAEAIVGLLAGPAGQVLRALLASDASSLEGVENLKQQIFASRRPLSARIVERASARGDVPADTDAYAVIDHLVAPIYFRLLLSDEPLDAALAARTAAAVAAAARAGAFVPQAA